MCLNLVFLTVLYQPNATFLKQSTLRLWVVSIKKDYNTIFVNSEENNYHHWSIPESKILKMIKILSFLLFRYWRTRVPDARDEYTNSVEKARDYRDLAFASSSEQLPYTSGSTLPPHLITKINLFMALQMALLLLLLLR